MASVQTSSYEGRYLKLTVTATPGTSSQNYSTIYWVIESIGGIESNYTISNYKVVVDGVTRDGDGSTVYWDDYVFPATKGSKGGSFTVQHNSDGTPPRDISFALHGKVFYSGDENKTGSISLSTIPRYFSSTPTLTLQSKTETAMIFKWTTPEACSASRYKINDGSWVDVETNIDKTSGIITVSGLSPDTTYTIYGDFKRKDSGLWAQTKPYVTEKTYDYPKINSTPDITIGNRLAIGIYNPLGRKVVVYIKGANNAEKGGDTTTGTVIAGYDDDSWKTWWYSTIPNLKYDSTAVYKVRLVCNELNRDTTVNGGTYKVIGTEIPTFSASNWSYIANLTQLTNNNQTIINGYSTIKFSVDTQAFSNYGASINSYTYIWGNKTKSSIDGDTIIGGTGNVLSCIAVDSRQLTNSQSKTLIPGERYVLYSTPTLDYEYCTVHRDNGISATTKLSLKGKLSVMKFGIDGIVNAIHSAKYQVYNNIDNTWSNEYDIPTSNFTLEDDGTFRLTNFNIHANGSSGGFAVGTRYTIRVLIKDAQGLLGTLTSANLAITDGKIARDVFQDSDGSYHQGINGMADDNYTNMIYGDENIQGALYINGVKTIWYE